MGPVINLSVLPTTHFEQILLKKSNGSYDRTEVIQNKSSLILKIILLNAQTLPLFEIRLNLEIINKIYLKLQVARLGFWKSRILQ